MASPEFVYVTHINAPAEKIWEALTQGEFTRQYWGGKLIQSDWTVGSPVNFIAPDGDVDLKGKVLQAVPPRLLSYTFTARSRDGSERAEGTQVTFEITVEFGVTKLKVTHAGLKAGSPLLIEVSQGWQAILSSLKTLLETGKPLPFTWR
jgi:uncharacterized protein YndB with AHSA1/START domain